MFFDYIAAENLLAGRLRADCPCPACGPGKSNPRSRLAPKLRYERTDWGGITYFCIRCRVSGALRPDSPRRELAPAERQAIDRRFQRARRREAEAAERKRELAGRTLGAKVGIARAAHG